MSKNYPDNVTVNWATWSLNAKDGTTIEPADSYSTDVLIAPLYPDGKVTPVGTCRKGWIPFEVPAKWRPEFIEYALPMGVSPGVSRRSHADDPAPRATVSRRPWTGGSTAASATPARPLKPSASACVMRSTWTRMPPSCWPSLTRPCSPRRCPYGSGQRPTLRRGVSGQQADPTPPRLDPLHAMDGMAPGAVLVSSVRAGEPSG